MATILDEAPFHQMLAVDDGFESSGFDSQVCPVFGPEFSLSSSVLVLEGPSPSSGISHPPSPDASIASRSTFNEADSA